MKKELPENVIKNYMEKLGISEQEAIELYNCDIGEYSNAEQEQLQKKAAAVGTGTFVGAATGPRPNRSKKVADLTKVWIINELFATIFEIADAASIKNPEKYIDFTLNGENYSLNLVKHRKKS